MGVEIERKFLVIGEPWRGLKGVRMAQAYVAVEAGRTVRVRLAGEAGTLTIKGPSSGIARAEFEVPIPPDMVEDLITTLALPGRIAKVRYEIPVGDHVFEVDVFEGENAGLVVAEVELGAEDEDFERPAWLGAEVSDDPRYLNVNLVRHPFARWGEL